MKKSIYSAIIRKILWGLEAMYYGAITVLMVLFLRDVFVHDGKYVFILMLICIGIICIRRFIINFNYLHEFFEYVYGDAYLKERVFDDYDSDEFEK